ncbi:hypothetical protein O181_003164 [Austropuccinia psidii MF-1]|uniref:Uncharacterized protein n=1 Tax=Austropuccinia psidii MF-1 TaxID=1389203 RepID=A0A9Q3GDK3_9BASI|nr:hypothetical protein [Austropuccinia psidii MF-1]
MLRERKTSSSKHSMPIYALPSLRQPESISPQFYFTSQSFISKAQTDVDALLDSWVDAAINQQSSKLGPFLKFKSIYSRLGWTYIHLSVVDPALRKFWFNSIVRLFLDKFKPNVEPLRQIGCLFALWCFWGTQPDVLGPKHYIVVDTTMYEFIQTFPENFADALNRCFKQTSDGVFFDDIQSDSNSSSNPPLSLAAIKHRAHLDPNLFGPPPPFVQPSHSLNQVVENLISQNAFFIEPKEIALVYPVLPTSKLVLENLCATTSTSQAHPSTTKAKTGSSSNLIPELIISAKHELERWKTNEEFSLSDLAELNESRSSYLSTKSFLNQSSSSDSEAADPLANELLTEAVGMTRKVIQKTGPGLDHLLFPTQSRPDETSLEAFFLVDGAKSVEELEDGLKNLKQNSV